MKTGLPFGIVNSSDSTAKCVCCALTIEKAGKNIEEHVGKDKHKEYRDLMEEHGITFNDYSNLQCKPCNVNLGENESVGQHVDSDAHANWIAAILELVEDEYVNIVDYLSSDVSNQNVICEACDCELECSLIVIQSHVNGEPHRDKVVDKLKPLNGIFNVDNDFEVWCKVCDFYIENTVPSIIEHIDEDEIHQFWLLDVEDIIIDQDISVKDFLANEHEQNAFCSRCDVKIACNSVDLTAHVTSDAHLNNLG